MNGNSALLTLWAEQKKRYGERFVLVIRSCSARAMCDLPIPGSPVSTTTQPSPSTAFHRQRRNSKSICSSRPISGVESGLVLCLEAAFHSARPHDVPGLYRFRPALECDWTKIAVFEMFRR